MSMLRHKNLHPLSHQHQHALSLCLLVERSLDQDDSAENIQKQATRCQTLFETEITNHFELEENILFPLVERELGAHPLVARLLDEHQHLRNTIAEIAAVPTESALRSFAQALRAHVRLEENEFFEDIQARLPAEAFDKAGEAMKGRATHVCVK